jgi:hypothetical protein
MSGLISTCGTEGAFGINLRNRCTIVREILRKTFDAEGILLKKEKTGGSTRRGN